MQEVAKRDLSRPRRSGLARLGVLVAAIVVVVVIVTTNLGGGSSSGTGSPASKQSKGRPAPRPAPPGGTARAIGHLPTARSDLSAVTIGPRAYVLGGYDGTSPVASVLATSDGRRFTEIARLPTPVRYAAVAALGRRIYAFGGELADGTDSNAIQAVDVHSHRARLIGRLPTPLSHASAVVLGGRIFVLGGRVAGAASDRILSFDPGRARLERAGRLPAAVTNAAAASAGEPAI